MDMSCLVVGAGCSWDGLDLDVRMGLKTEKGTSCRVLVCNNMTDGQTTTTTTTKKKKKKKTPTFRRLFYCMFLAFFILMCGYVS